MRRQKYYPIGNPYVVATRVYAKVYNVAIFRLDTNDKEQPVKYECFLTRAALARNAPGLCVDKKTAFLLKDYNPALLMAYAYMNQASIEAVHKTLLSTIRSDKPWIPPAQLERS